MKPRIPKGLPTPVRRAREGMSESHLAMVRKLPCCVCGIGPIIEAHHLLRTEEKGMARKSSDRWAVPLCSWPHPPGCHDRLHADGNEERFLTQHGIDGRALASALWACRNHDHPLRAMGRVVFNSQQRAQQKRSPA